MAGVAALAGGWRPATSRDAQPGSGHPFASVSPAASRIDWTRTAGKSATKYLPETTGAGAAFLDYNNDGRMDVYLVNSGPCDFFRPQRPLRNALYRNDGDGGFTDVTEQAGVGGGGFGQGAAAGDYDADGFTDLYVTQYGRSILYRNNRDGSFTDATDKAGVGAPGWAASAAWFEYDNDGRLDLFVCRFADFDRPNTAPATTAASRNTASPGWASSEAWR